MCPDIVSGPLGAEASYDLAFSAGALNLTVSYKGAQASASMTATVSGAQLLQALAAKLTNPTEIALVNGLAAIIAAIP